MGLMAKLRRGDYSREWERYQEVKNIMSNLEKTSLYTQFRMACSYHMLTHRTALDEAIKLWLDKNKWDQKMPRHAMDKKDKEVQGEDIKKYLG